MESSKNGNNIDDLLEEGLILYGMAQFEEAAVKWRKVIELDPRNAQALEYLDIVNEDISPKPIKDADVPEKSADPVETVVEPDSAAAAELISKGLAALENGSPDEAVDSFREALKAGAQSADVYGYIQLAMASKLETLREIVSDQFQTPRVAADYESIKKSNLSAEEGFMLSQIDGSVTIRDLSALIRIEKADATAILLKLLLLGLITVEQGDR